MEEMTYVGQTIKQLRLQRGLTQRQLARLAKVANSYLVLLEKGQRKGISYAVATKLAGVLGVSPDVFFTRPNTTVEITPRPFEAVIRELEQRYELFETMEVPILGTAPFGYPAPEEEEIEDYISVPKAELGKVSKNVYALRAIGECLIGDGISSGDLVIVDPDYELVNGKIYIVRLENEVVARHIYREGEQLKLVATNEEYEVILPANEVEILGRVVLSGSWRKH